MSHTASDVFVESLMECGVETVFGLPGEESRKRIALTIGRSMLEEAGDPASPHGVLARAREKVGR